MYLGMLVILLGTSVLLKSILLIIVPIVYLFVIQIFYIRKEEQAMIQEFGDEYLDYKNKVRSWI